jgi:hypothetical protein
MVRFGPGAFAAAFAAGIVSFVSPCVLPLIPGYLSFVSGVGFDQLGARPRRVVGQTTWFVFGFGVMFALLGPGPPGSATRCSCTGARSRSPLARSSSSPG